MSPYPYGQLTRSDLQSCTLQVPRDNRPRNRGSRLNRVWPGARAARRRLFRLRTLSPKTALLDGARAAGFGRDVRYLMVQTGAGRLLSRGDSIRFCREALRRADREVVCDLRHRARRPPSRAMRRSGGGPSFEPYQQEARRWHFGRSSAGCLVAFPDKIAYVVPYYGDESPRLARLMLVRWTLWARVAD